MNTQTLDPKIQTALDDNSNCYQACVLTMLYCIQMGNEHAEPKHVSLLMDCAELTELTEHFILRQPDNTEYLKDLAQITAKVTMLCAESCENLAPEDEQMKACAQICRKAAESCRAL